MGLQLTHDPIELQFPFKTQTKPVVDTKKKAGFFGFGGGGTELETENTDIRNNTLKNTKKMMASASLEAVSTNQQSFSALLLSKNTMTIANIICAGDFNFGGPNAGIDQKNEVDVTANIKMATSVSTSMKTSMSNSFTDAMCDKTKVGGSSLEGMVGKVVDGVAGVAKNSVNALAGVLGNSTSEKTRNTTIENIKTELNTAVENYLNVKLSNENVQAAVIKAQADNEIVVKDIQCGGDANIKGIAQTNVIKGFLEALFENEVSTDLEQIMLTEMSATVDVMFEGTGDIAAIGSALAENINAIGDAAPGIGDGIANAITPVTEASADTAQTAIYAMIVPAIVFIIVVGVVVYSQSAGAKTNNNA